MNKATVSAVFVVFVLIAFATGYAAAPYRTRTIYVPSNSQITVFPISEAYSWSPKSGYTIESTSSITSAKVVNATVFDAGSFLNATVFSVSVQGGQSYVTFTFPAHPYRNWLVFNCGTYVQQTPFRNETVVYSISALINCQDVELVIFYK